MYNSYIKSRHTRETEMEKAKKIDSGHWEFMGWDIEKMEQGHWNMKPKSEFMFTDSADTLKEAKLMVKRFSE
jgi:phosphopentomutase